MKTDCQHTLSDQSNVVGDKEDWGQCATIPIPYHFLVFVFFFFISLFLSSRVYRNGVK